MKYTTKQEQYLANQKDLATRRLIIRRAEKLYAEWKLAETETAAVAAKKDFQDWMELFQLSSVDIRNVICDLA